MGKQGFSIIELIASEEQAPLHSPTKPPKPNTTGAPKP